MPFCDDQNKGLVPFRPGTELAFSPCRWHTHVGFLDEPRCTKTPSQSNRVVGTGEADDNLLSAERSSHQ